MKPYLDWKHISFAHPWFLLLLAVIPVMIWWQLKRKQNENPVFRLTAVWGLAGIAAAGKAKYRPWLFVLRVITLVALIIALARPQTSNTTENIDSDGIDICLGIDVSGSMLAEDFKPNRYEAAKAEAIKFVDQRPADRIGLVIFAGESFTMCPITIDHNVLKDQISSIKAGMIVDGTSIGMGLATAVDRLRNAKGKSKVVILMTDGVNNTGIIAPLTALEIAKAYHIKVYTIGIGTNGEAYISVPTPNGVQRVVQKVEIDEPLLRKIAGETGGMYFRATGNKSLRQIYDDIDKMEKTTVEVSSFKHYAELFFPFAMIAVFCLALELVLRLTVFKSITA
jgi:Ca-activated chloride channel homolog